MLMIEEGGRCRNDDDDGDNVDNVDSDGGGN